ncbi:hypothetical protein L1987_20074 [Smallanthus sonchifolius]|uniref:Uncharacterized protein n=1 Tax=Smallanthus sonchifolius TaxID=185202 RepID=A0ACB9ISH8_9ASTR|nr:hypothetical protein L1987_20074 [Smallanthus sonchifolius]
MIGAHPPRRSATPPLITTFAASSTITTACIELEEETMHLYGFEFIRQARQAGTPSTGCQICKAAATTRRGRGRGASRSAAAS